MRYAKLINNFPSYAPRRLRLADVWVYNPTDAQLLAEGYLPVIETEPPETDTQHYAEPHWTERDGSIVQTWEVAEIPGSDEADAADYEAALREVGVNV